MFAGAAAEPVGAAQFVEHGAANTLGGEGFELHALACVEPGQRIGQADHANLDQVVDFDVGRQFGDHLVGQTTHKRAVLFSMESMSRRPLAVYMFCSMASIQYWGDTGQAAPVTPGGRTRCRPGFAPRRIATVLPPAPEIQRWDRGRRILVGPVAGCDAAPRKLSAQWARRRATSSACFERAEAHTTRS